MRVDLCMQTAILAGLLDLALATQPLSWSAAYQQASAIVNNLTLLEMQNITYGFSNQNACSGSSGAIPRVGYPGMCFQDAENGVRGQEGVNAYPASIHIGSSWNRDLAYQRGQHMGAEFRRKGVDVALGPVVGPIGRIAMGGRNWEGFAADPYLDGQISVPTIKGMQENVIACIKHFVANEQETNRTASLLHPGGLAVSSNVDDKTLQELYVWPFQDAVDAGVGVVMCSYNRVNQNYSCENDKTLNGILKGELDFKGFVLSDWGAQQSGLLSASAGLDLAMPTSTYWDQGQLAGFVTNGSLSRTRLENMATRILATWLKFKKSANLTSDLGFGVVFPLTEPHMFINARNPEAAPSIFQQAQEGHVLVKNVNNALPLKKPRVLSIFGQDAFPAPVEVPTPLLTFDLFTVNFQNLFSVIAQAFFYGTAFPLTVDGTLIVGGGSGANNAPYISTPFDAIQNRAIADGTQLYWDAVSTNPQVVGYNDACLVFLNAFSAEGWDRLSGLSDPDGDQLVMNVASKCSNTMVFIHNAGIRVVDAWINHPNVTAVMYAHLPGQDAGRALTSLIYGDVSPSGRLVYTVAKNESDYGTLLSPCVGAPDNFNPQCNFTEGVNIDYRSFLARNVTPRYEFGYGLTYSSFAYADLSINKTTALTRSHALSDVVATVTARIRNTGTVAAAEVAQLYLRIPGADTKVLRGFSKTQLRPNASSIVKFPLRRKDISQWNTFNQSWTQPKGLYAVDVGASVLDTKLRGTFSI